MSTAQVPCQPWATIDDLQTFAESVPNGWTDDQMEILLDVASAWLYRASARQFPGTCTRTVRPMRQCAPLARGPYAVDSATGVVSSLSARGGSRRFEDAREVTLGVYPLREILEVKIDGATLAASAYRIDDARWLVRVDGEPWPATNDLHLADTETGTWSVRFEFGDDPPVDGVRACCALAGELALTFTRDDKARLPSRTTQLNRQGVSLTLMDPEQLLEGGLFGIPEVDYFLRSVNPHGLARAPAVVSPDLPRPVRRVATLPGS